jgi:hypothetical protein
MMYRTVADAALIEAAQRIVLLVRARRDEGERKRRLPAQVPTAMHEARLFRMHISKPPDSRPAGSASFDSSRPVTQRNNWRKLVDIAHNFEAFGEGSLST